MHYLIIYFTYNNNPVFTLIQTCSEMAIPISIGNNTMFEQPIPFNLTRYAEGCKKQYGVSPRPHWVTTYYGGHVSAFFSSLHCNIHMDYYALFSKWHSLCCNFYKKFVFNCIDHIWKLQFNVANAEY